MADYSPLDAAAPLALLILPAVPKAVARMEAFLANFMPDFNALCTKAEGRDKLARLFQYAARALVGFLGAAHPVAGSSLATYETHARTIMGQLASARRTHRWCKEFPVIQSIPAAFKVKDPLDMVMELAQKVSLATFMMIDHIGHLKQWKIIPGGKRAGSGTIQLGLKFFCFSNSVAALVQFKKILSLRGCDDEKSRAARGKSMQAVAKHLLLVLQTASLSRLRETDDRLVGVAGMVTSVMDLEAQWPAKPAKAAKALPAQPKDVASAPKDVASTPKDVIIQNGASGDEHPGVVGAGDEKKEKQQ